MATVHFEVAMLYNSKIKSRSTKLDQRLKHHTFLGVFVVSSDVFQDLSIANPDNNSISGKVQEHDRFVDTLNLKHFQVRPSGEKKKLFLHHINPQTCMWEDGVPHGVYEVWRPPFAYFPNSPNLMLSDALNGTPHSFDLSAYRCAQAVLRDQDEESCEFWEAVRSTDHLAILKLSNSFAASPEEPKHSVFIHLKAREVEFYVRWHHYLMSK
jgi:hypothetical protein